MTNNHPLDHQTSTTHTDGWRITARCSATWANKTRLTSILPCDKRPRCAASTEDTRAHNTTPPRIRTYDPGLPPYGATNGRYIQRYTPISRKLSMTPRILPDGWTPHAGSSGSGTSAGQRNWHKNSNAIFRTPSPTSRQSSWTKSWGKLASEASMRYDCRTAQ